MDTITNVAGMAYNLLESYDLLIACLVGLIANSVIRKMG